LVWLAFARWQMWQARLRAQGTRFLGESLDRDISSLGIPSSNSSSTLRFFSHPFVTLFQATSCLSFRLCQGTAFIPTFLAIKPGRRASRSRSQLGQTFCSSINNANPTTSSTTAQTLCIAINMKFGAFFTTAAAATLFASSVLADVDPIVIKVRKAAGQAASSKQTSDSPP
jgi:hypothetical protein